jgi:hypothetical protein
MRTTYESTIQQKKNADWKITTDSRLETLLNSERFMEEYDKATEDWTEKIETCNQEQIKDDNGEINGGGTAMFKGWRHPVDHLNQIELM